MNIYRNYNDNKNTALFNVAGNSNYAFAGPAIPRFKNRKAYLTWTSRLDVFGCYLNDNIQELNINQLYKFKSLKRGDSEYLILNSSDIFDGRILFAYENAEGDGTGYDIWANIQVNEAYKFNKEIFRQPVNDDALYANFPNPFNAKTNISYKIFSYHKVKIEIFDILGRKVKILVDKYQEAGHYTIEFDATNLTSGVYFCRMEAFNIKVIKLLLVQ